MKHKKKYIVYAMAILIVVLLSYNYKKNSIHYSSITKNENITSQQISAHPNTALTENLLYYDNCIFLTANDTLHLVNLDDIIQNDKIGNIVIMKMEGNNSEPTASYTLPLSNNVIDYQIAESGYYKAIYITEEEIYDITSNITIGHEDIF